MKKNKLLIILLTNILFSSCSFSSSSSSYSFSSSSTSSSSYSSSSISSSNESYSSSEEETNLNTLELKSLVSGSYAENFDVGTINKVSFSYYRASRFLNGVVTLKPQYNLFDIDKLNGALLNNTPIYGMKKIEINYLSNTTSCKAKLYYSNDRSYNNFVELDASSTYLTYTIPVNGNFFKIETGDAELEIKSMNIIYDGEVTSFDNYDYDYSNDYYRLNPSTFEGTLISGVSKVTVPMSVTKKDDGYIINETKTYTYYSYDEVIKDASLAYEVALTDPVDIANYYIAFNEYPVNYVPKTYYSDATSYFKEKTRCVSYYSRTNGYATSVPYRIYQNNKPLYYELDIALDSKYSASNRGVGRLVVFITGFNATNYNNSNVALYTDDHYQTFSEYLNTGIFGARFNAENAYLVNTTWKNVITLN